MKLIFVFIYFVVITLLFVAILEKRNAGPIKSPIREIYKENICGIKKGECK